MTEIKIDERITNKRKDNKMIGGSEFAPKIPLIKRIERYMPHIKKLRDNTLTKDREALTIALQALTIVKNLPTETQILTMLINGRWETRGQLAHQIYERIGEK